MGNVLHSYCIRPGFSASSFTFTPEKSLYDGFLDGGDYYDFDIAGMESPLSEEQFAVLENTISKLTYATGREMGFDILMDEFLTQYYRTDTLSAEDCARQIQDGAYIYYNE